MVSVIIPTFNCAKYIETSVSSVIAQSYSDIEVIIVDDGSSDETELICRNICIRDTRVKYFKTVNSGVSHARNYGLMKAMGDFIVFLDADDFLEPKIIENALQLTNTDSLIIWDYVIVGDECPKSHICSKNGFIDKDEAIASALTQRNSCKYKLGSYYRAVWGKLFSADIIKSNNITFPENLPVGEDALFLIDYLTHCTQVIICNCIGYNYRILSNSAVRKYRSNLLDLDILQMDYLLKIIADNKLLEYESVRISFSNFKWQLLFDSLLENSIDAYKNKKIGLFNITDDLKAFEKRYRYLYEDALVDFVTLHKKYGIIQFLYGKMPLWVLCVVYLVVSRLRG